MKNRILSLLLLCAFCFALPLTSYASESSGGESSASEGEPSMDLDLPRPVIDKVELGQDENGNEVLRVTAAVPEKVREINDYYVDNGGYPIGVEFQVDINNEGALLIPSNGENAVDGVYTFTITKTNGGRTVRAPEAYLVVAMRYTYDYDWVRVSQSDWSDTVEFNAHLSGVNAERDAQMSATVTTVLWICGGVLLVVLLIFMFRGGDVRCHNCRGRVPRKTAICPKCGHDMKNKKADPPAQQE